VNFGDPIDVSDYWNDYSENPSVAINKLRDRLSEEMKKVMINIETEEYYDLYMGLRAIYNRNLCRKLRFDPNDLYNRHIADKLLIDILNRCLEKEPGKIEEANKLFREYKRLRIKLNYRDWVVRKKRYSILVNLLIPILSLITLPLFILGLFNNWPHFFIPTRITKGIRDKQFHSTAKWGFGAALMIIYYPLLAILALIFLSFWWLKILYILVMPSSGIYALSYRKFLIKSWIRIRYSVGMMKKKSQTRQLRSYYEQLVAIADQIYSQYSKNTAE
jgi:hypothetical protein